MVLKKSIIYFLAKKNKKTVDNWVFNSINNQRALFKNHVLMLSKTLFGKNIKATKHMSLRDFRNTVPISSYENISNYIEKIANGESSVLWPGRVLYFAKTSGTTSGIKYIPLTKEMLRNQINASREALLLYAYKEKKYNIIDGKMMFLQGSPSLYNYKKIRTGRLSGIVAHHIPFFLQKNRLPSMKVNSIEAWEEKLIKIVGETLNTDLRLIGGIPPWVIMYFQKILIHGKKNNIREVFPNLSLYVHGGVNFSPYKNTLTSLLPEVDFLEYYPASEGFIAYQDDIKNDSLLLLTNHGIFYEFIEDHNFIRGVYKRLSLEEVVLQKNYVLILNTCSGLWGYNLGDTIRFVSLNPYRIVVTGRVNHFISAFGEHVIAKEIESALALATQNFGGEVFGFTVCPNITPKTGLPHHEWFIEFVKKPSDFSGFVSFLDTAVQNQNIYYNDLIKGGVLKSLVVNSLKVGSFNNYMDSIGKLGGQNKCPILSNNRIIGDYLRRYLEKNG